MINKKMKREVFVKKVEDLQVGDSVTVSEFGILILAEVDLHEEVDENENVYINKGFIKLTLNVFDSTGILSVLTKVVPKGIEVPTYESVYESSSEDY